MSGNDFDKIIANASVLKTEAAADLTNIKSLAKSEGVLNTEDGRIQAHNAIQRSLNALNEREKQIEANPEPMRDGDNSWATRTHANWQTKMEAAKADLMAADKSLGYDSKDPNKAPTAPESPEKNAAALNKAIDSYVTVASSELINVSERAQDQYTQDGAALQQKGLTAQQQAGIQKDLQADVQLMDAIKNLGGSRAGVIKDAQGKDVNVPDVVMANLAGDETAYLQDHNAMTGGFRGKMQAGFHETIMEAVKNIETGTVTDIKQQDSIPKTKPGRVVPLVPGQNGQHLN